MPAIGVLPSARFYSAFTPLCASVIWKPLSGISSPSLCSESTVPSAWEGNTSALPLSSHLFYDIDAMQCELMLPRPEAKVMKMFDTLVT